MLDYLKNWELDAPEGEEYKEWKMEQKMLLSHETQLGCKL